MATQQEEQQGAYAWDKTAKEEQHPAEGEQPVSKGEALSRPQRVGLVSSGETCPGIAARGRLCRQLKLGHPPKRERFTPQYPNFFVGNT